MGSWAAPWRGLALPAPSRAEATSRAQVSHDISVMLHPRIVYAEPIQMGLAEHGLRGGGSVFTWNARYTREPSQKAKVSLRAAQDHRDIGDASHRNAEARADKRKAPAQESCALSSSQTSVFEV